MVLSAGTPASSITKTGCHDIAEILLKVALNTKNQKSIIKLQENESHFICVALPIFIAISLVVIFSF
jgi:hypothetical protein